MSRSKTTNSKTQFGSFYQSANTDERSIQEVINALKNFLSDEVLQYIEEIFKQFNVMLRIFEDYEGIVNLQRGLINLINSLTVEGLTQLDEHQTPNTKKVEDPSNHDLKNEKTVEQSISLLDCLKLLANNVAYSKRIGFMRDVLNAPNKKEILFSNVFTEERINKRYRKLASYFHPDKTSCLNIPDELREEYITLGTELFKCALKIKKSLFELEESSKNDNFTQTSPQTLHEEKANELWKTAIDYRNAHKAQWDKLKLLKKERLIGIPSEELKRNSTDYGLLAYEEYRAACKLADNNKQLKSQIKLRGYMALSLYICDKFMEAQLYALAAINLVIRNSTNATQQDLYEAKQIFDKVKSGNPCESENIQLNTEIKPKNSPYNSSYALVKTENLVNEFSFLEKNFIYRSIKDDLEKIITELMLKADRKLVRYQANKEEILRTKRQAYLYNLNGLACLGLAGCEAITTVVVASVLGSSMFTPLSIITGLLTGYIQIKRGTQLLGQPKNREALNEIMKQALLAYDKGDHQKFFEELSKEYKSGSRLLNLESREDIIQHKVIVNTLLEHGFRADGIAYLLILISEVLISGKIKIEGKTTKEVKTEGYLVLKGVLSEILVNKASELDDRIKNLRKTSWKDYISILSLFESIFMNLVKIHDYGKIAQEYIDDAKEMTFVSRLEEMRNIARINLAIGDILDNGPEEIERAVELIKEIRESINSHHQYIGMVETRIEALEDLLWVISGKSVPNNFELRYVEN
jgi:hypothetical protein